ncbi:MAG: cupin domain-containing protein [Planctomycetales bacterium]
MEPHNLFSHLPHTSPEEIFETLARTPDVTIERIVSLGHASPPCFWYDQPRDEWVVLLTGAARLQFEEESGLIPLQPGDYLLIPAHKRHRVDWTDPAQPSVWLAIHFKAHS